MDDLFRSYLNFLRSMARGLEAVTALNEKKMAAAQADDLAALNELMKQDQAQSLNFRGLDQSRERLLPKMGLTGVPMSKVPEHFPPELREEARQAVEALRERYRAYHSGAEKARKVLEGCRQEVDSMIAELGGPEVVENSLNYHKNQEAAPIAAPPPKMKTDFRA